MVPKMILVGGGARSGKSAYALRRALALGARRVFVATAEAGDEEMAARIARHQAERGDVFTTLEVPRELVTVLEHVDDEVDVVLVDCLTLWLSNLLCADWTAEAVEAEVARLTEACARRRFHLVLVGNEVGLGLVPESALGRTFRDVAGRTHQALGAVADEVYLAALGQILRLKPGPVEAVT